MVAVNGVNSNLLFCSCGSRCDPGSILLQGLYYNPGTITTLPIHKSVPFTDTARQKAGSVGKPVDALQPVPLLWSYSNADR